MKKIFIFLSIIALGVSAASCSDLNTYPVFDDKDAFVELGTTTAMIAESGDTLKIPVTLVSLSGKTENVSYVLEDGTAKLGVDYELVDPTATLKFSAETRTQNILVKIINRAGVYTGDLKFKVSLKSAGSCALGVNTSCTVTITDNDHPLASILGSYTATDKTYGKADQSWTVNFTKDEEDVTLVHIDAIIKWLEGSSKGDIVGTVSEDMNTITIANGQKIKVVNESETDFFMLITWTDGIYIDTTTDIVLTQTSAGVWECKDNIGFMSSESEKLYSNTIDRGPLKMVKK